MKRILSLLFVIVLLLLSCAGAVAEEPDYFVLEPIIMAAFEPPAGEYWEDSYSRAAFSVLLVADAALHENLIDPEGVNYGCSYLAKDEDDYVLCFPYMNNSLATISYTPGTIALVIINTGELPGEIIASIIESGLASSGADYYRNSPEDIDSLLPFLRELLASE